MVKFIWNQDRDAVVPFTGELHTFPAYHNGIMWGINLYTGIHFLGTFDSVADAVKEMNRIRRSLAEIYKVRGFAKWTVWETLKELWRHADEMA